MSRARAPRPKIGKKKRKWLRWKETPNCSELAPVSSNLPRKKKKEKETGSVTVSHGDVSPWSLTWALSCTSFHVPCSRWALLIMRSHKSGCDETAARATALENRQTADLASAADFTAVRNQAADCRNGFRVPWDFWLVSHEPTTLFIKIPLLFLISFSLAKWCWFPQGISPQWAFHLSLLLTTSTSSPTVADATIQCRANEAANQSSSRRFLFVCLWYHQLKRSRALKLACGV